MREPSKHAGRGGTVAIVILAIVAVLLLAVVIWLLLGGELPFFGPEESPSPSVQTSESPAAGTASPSPSPTPAEQVLSGTVVDALMNTLVVEDAGGIQYTFDKSNVQVDSGEAGIQVGAPVTVRYLGTLDPEKIVQEVEILSIAVESGPASDPETEVAPPSIDPDANVTTEDKAKNLLAEMSLEEKVGQMFVVRCPDAGAVEKVSQYHLGGYILFGRDFEGKSREEVIADIQRYQDAAEIPLLIGADEEGGTVCRVSLNPALRANRFQSPQELDAQGGYAAIQADTREKCALLLDLGLNMNLAPVCDISQDPNDFIYDRAFGQGAAATAQYVDTVVTEMRANRVGATLKHFPGYGSNVDTHTGIAHDQRPYSTFVKEDFLPFQAGIQAGAEMVLVSHNIVECMDPEYPASLSPQVHELLREELGFRGVIFTDDLAMDGVRDYTGDQEAAVLAVLAGNDVLCCTDFETQYPAVLAAVEGGRIQENRIDESVLRILEMKISLGLL